LLVFYYDKNSVKKGITVSGRPQQITFSLTGEQNEKLEVLKKLTGNDTKNIFREALHFIMKR